MAEPPKGEFEAEYVRGSEVVRWSIDLAAPAQSRFTGYPEFASDDEPWTTYVDPSSTLFSQDFFDGEPIYHSRLDAPEEYPKDEGERLRGILGKTYDRLSWQECYDDGLVLPFFTVRSNGREYSSDAMSAGEIWVHYVLWVLRTAEPSNIVLIDEPEAFLSQRGHVAFLNEIARKALASKAQVVVSTHSQAMIAATPTEFLRVITSSPSGATVGEPTTTSAVLRMLGHEPGVRAVVIVEDEFATRVVKRALSVLAPDVAGGIDVVKADGADGAISAGRALRASSRLGSCVVLDGDQRGRVFSDRNTPAPIFLPGDDAPEVAVSAPSRANPAALAVLLGRATDAVVCALETNGFDDHHDWFASTAVALDISRETLIDNVVLVWLTDEATSNEAAALVEQMRMVLTL
jgi:hypothetical protein